MSRGHGRIQRDIIAVLENRDTLIDTYELAGEVYRLEPNGDNQIVLNDARLVSVRRALVKLAEEGKIFKIMRGSNKRAYWASERLGLWHTVRAMQRRTLEIGATGDFNAVMAHADRMLPMIHRARELAVKVDAPFNLHL